jgi:hypothetical protein
MWSFRWRQMWHRLRSLIVSSRLGSARLGSVRRDFNEKILLGPTAFICDYRRCADNDVIGAEAGDGSVALQGKDERKLSTG